MHATKISIPEKNRSGLIALLNERLADAIDLQAQSKFAHWNVKGPNFIGLHKLFDEVNEAVEEHVDMIAERLTALGGTAEGRIAQVAKQTSLPAYPDAKDGRGHVDALSTALAAFGKAIRNSIDKAEELEDKCTADLFTEVARDADKYLWFVEAHLQAER